jgi:SAM-dependent methyltransferase
MLRILERNQGFAQPERWVDYALSHSFRPVSAQKLQACPNCGGASHERVGQYIYYSTLVGLRRCNDCTLVFADTRLDPEVVRSHFERVYKDEEYFVRHRAAIFARIADLVARFAPIRGRVLDLGGAKGHLMASVRDRRPDLTLVVNDVSWEACKWAELKYGLQTICGDLDAVGLQSYNSNVVVISDALYYQPRLRRFWDVLSRLVSPGGIVIIRVPKHLALIRLSQFLSRAAHGGKDSVTATRVRFFNPEHLYVFPVRFLLDKLRALGFSQAIAMPSPLASGRFWGLLATVYYRAAKMLHVISGGRLVITPSVIIVAKGFAATG